MVPPANPEDAAARRIAEQIPPGETAREIAGMMLAFRDWPESIAAFHENLMGRLAGRGKLAGHPRSFWRK